MGLELGTYIDDLLQTNPLGSDDKRQGDDHLRLIKKVLQNTIKRASKAFYLPSSIAKNANYTVLDTDENMTIQCTTTSPFTLILPTLDITRAGWMVNIVKASTDMNPVFLFPGTGTINGFTKIRRSVAATITQVVWTGTVWVASRPHGAPIGTVLEYYGTNLPQGHLWANGGTIDAANYVEAASVLGALTPDKRGRVGVGRDDMGGTAALRITAAESGIVGTTLLASGGAQSLALTTAQLPIHVHDLRSSFNFGGGLLGIGTESQGHRHGWGSIGQAGANGQVDGVTGRFITHYSSSSGFDLNHAHPFTASISNQTQISGPGGLTVGAAIADSGTGLNSTLGYSLDHYHRIDIGGTTDTETANHQHSISGSTQNTGSGATHTNMPPSLVCNAIVVAE